MTCPYCNCDFHPQPEVFSIGVSSKGNWMVQKIICPGGSCGELILNLLKYYQPVGRSGEYRFAARLLPHRAHRKAATDGVTTDLLDDYREACAVLEISPKASAALTRRCLQHILRDKAKVKHGDLASEIQQVLDSGVLPGHLADSIDAVRNIGNFAAHPIKSTSSGEVMVVEPGEAEWNLDVVEALFDFYFVQPTLLADKRAALNKKLSDAGKRPMK
jgi:hypothetical protein